MTVRPITVALAAVVIGSCRSAPRAVHDATPSVSTEAAVASTSAAEPIRDAGSAATPVVEVEAGLPPLAGAPFETWRSGDLDVVASLPLGARERRPIVVGVHGSRDRPDASCARWRRTVAAWAFVVCPKGVPYRGGLAWGAPAGLAERIDGVVAALRERHGAYVADGPVVYAGWSLGGTLGPKVVALRPGIFDPVVLVEIGHTRLDATASAAALRTGHTSHAIVACATRRCASFAKRLATAKSAPSVAVVDAGIGRGHVFDDRMARTIGGALARVVANDARWAGFAAALEASPASEDGGIRAEPLPEEDDEPELL